MAAAAADHDPLLLLRQAIASGSPFVPSTSADPDDESTSSVDTPLAQASHLRFTRQPAALPLDAPTRFISNERPVDLRSIYFAWLNRELAIPEYNASATTLNERLAAAGSGGKVQNLGFIERLDLITWLEGASEESEYIKPLAGDANAAAAGAAPEAKSGTVSAAAKARSGKGTMDPRLASVYDAERRMGDRNTVLRGIKPTVRYPCSLPLSQMVVQRSEAYTLFRTSPTCGSSQCPSSRKSPTRPRPLPASTRR